MKNEEMLRYKTRKKGWTILCTICRITSENSGNCALHTGHYPTLYDCHSFWQVPLQSLSMGLNCSPNICQNWWRIYFVTPKIEVYSSMILALSENHGNHIFSFYTRSSLDYKTIVFLWIHEFVMGYERNWLSWVLAHFYWTQNLEKEGGSASGFEEQDRYYNGWTHSHYVSAVIVIVFCSDGAVIVFCPDGTIPIVAYNVPGSVHDSMIAEWGGVYEKLGLWEV